QEELPHHRAVQSPVPLGFPECLPQLRVQPALDPGGLQEPAVVREDYIRRGDGQHPGRAAHEPSAPAELVAESGGYTAASPYRSRLNMRPTISVSISGVNGF